MNLFNLALVPSVAVTVLFIFISGLIIWKYSEKEKGNKKEFTQYMINSAYYGLVVVYLMSFAYEAFGNSVTRESMSALMANTSSTPANTAEDLEQRTSFLSLLFNLGQEYFLFLFAGLMLVVFHVSVREIGHPEKKFTLSKMIKNGGRRLGRFFLEKLANGYGVEINEKKPKDEK